MGFKLRKRRGGAKSFFESWLLMRKMRETEMMNQAKLAYFQEKGDRDRERLENDMAVKNQRLGYEQMRTHGSLLNLADQARHRGVQERLANARFQHMQMVNAERLSLDKTRTSSYVKNMQLGALAKQQDIEMKQGGSKFAKELFKSGAELAENKDFPTTREKSTLLGSKAAEILDQIPGIDPRAALSATRAVTGLMFPKQKTYLKEYVDPDGKLIMDTYSEDGRRIYSEERGLSDKHAMANRKAVLHLQDKYQQELNSRTSAVHSRYGLSTFDTTGDINQFVKDYDTIRGKEIESLGSERDYILKRMKSLDPKTLEWYDKVIAPRGVQSNEARDAGTKALREKLLGYAGRPDFWQIQERMKQAAKGDPQTAMMLDRAMASIYEDFNIHNPEDLDREVDFSEESERYDFENPKDEDEDWDE
jgi:hypothetical protein